MRIAILWMRNMAIAFAIIFGLFAFGFTMIFLTEYFGAPLFSFIAIGTTMLAWLCFMCYKVAREQYDAEERRSKRVMETLKR
jgi:uncharacterized membrane protein